MLSFAATSHQLASRQAKDPQSWAQPLSNKFYEIGFLFGDLFGHELCLALQIWRGTISSPSARAACEKSCSLSRLLQALERTTFTQDP